MTAISKFESPGLLLTTPRRFGDDRGWFLGTWSKASLEAAGAVLPDFVLDNHNFSVPRPTLKGLHYQGPPRALDKLERCSRGRMLDGAVDVRLRSPTYGQFEAVTR